MTMAEIDRMVASPQLASPTTLASDGKDAKKIKRRLMAVMKKTENRVCADCTEKRPTFGVLIRPPVDRHGVATVEGSQMLCVFCCLRCSTAHRNLGPQTSLVRSTTSDEWSEEEVKAAEIGGNKRVNEIYEANLNENPASSTTIKPMAGSHEASRDRFVQNKYSDRIYYSQQKHVELVQKSIASSTKSLTLKLKKDKQRTNNGDDDDMSFASSAFSAFGGNTSMATFQTSTQDTNIATSPHATKRRSTLVGMIRNSILSPRPGTSDDVSMSASSASTSLAGNLRKVAKQERDDDDNSLDPKEAAAPISPRSGKFNRSAIAPQRMLIKTPSTHLQQFAASNASGLDVSLHDSDSFNEGENFDEETTIPSVAGAEDDKKQVEKPNSNKSKGGGVAKPKLMAVPATPNSMKGNARMNLYSAGGGVRNKVSKDTKRDRSVSRDPTSRNNGSSSDLKSMIEGEGNDTPRRPRSRSRARDSISVSNDRLGTDVAKKSPRTTRSKVRSGRVRRDNEDRDDDPESKEKDHGDDEGSHLHATGDEPLKDHSSERRDNSRGRSRRARSSSRSRLGEKKDSTKKVDKGSGRSRSSSKVRRDGDRASSKREKEKSSKDEAGDNARPSSSRSRSSSSQRGFNSSRTFSNRDEDDDNGKNDRRHKSPSGRMKTSERRPSSERIRSKSAEKKSESEQRPSSGKSLTRRASKDNSDDKVIPDEKVSSRPGLERRPSRRASADKAIPDEKVSSRPGLERRPSRRASADNKKIIPSDPIRGRDNGRGGRSRTRSTSRAAGDRTRSTSRAASGRERSTSRNPGDRTRSASRTRGGEHRLRSDENRKKLRERSRGRLKSSLANKSLQNSLNSSKSKLSGLDDKSVSLDDMVSKKTPASKRTMEDSVRSMDSEISSVSGNLSVLFSGTLTKDTKLAPSKGPEATTTIRRRSRTGSKSSIDKSNHSTDSSVDESFLKEQAETTARIRKKDFKKGGESYLRMARRRMDQVEKRQQQRESIKSSVFAALDSQEEDLVKTTSGPLMKGRIAPGRTKSADLMSIKHTGPLKGINRTRSGLTTRIKSKAALGDSGNASMSRLNFSSNNIDAFSASSSNLVDRMDKTTRSTNRSAAGLGVGSSHSDDDDEDALGSSQHSGGAWQKRRAENHTKKQPSPNKVDTTATRTSSLGDFGDFGGE